MYAEEQFLTRKFGQTYTDWAEGVPPFIPSFKNFKKPSLRFSWKKVMKKEKNGLFAMFLLFALFDMSGEYVHGTTDYNMFLVYGCITTGVAYIILKFLKKKTSVLDEEGR